MNLVIIPARGGSKGIPKKNLRRLRGKPLLCHSIEHALHARLVDRVIVSTDDDEIAAVSLQSGAEVIRRPPELAGDNVASEDALLHVLDSLAKHGEVEPDLVVFLQATSPVRRQENIDGAIQVLRSGDFDSVFSVSPAHGFVWEVREGEPRPLTYDPGSRPMRQQIGERVMENGSIYVFRPAVLRKYGVRMGGKIGIYRMGFLEALQIDEPDDLALAEWILERWPPGEKPLDPSEEGRPR